MRRTSLWIALVTFAIVAVCQIVAFLLSRYYVDPLDGWAISTDNGNTIITSRASRIMERCQTISAIGLPIGLIALMVYLILTEKMLVRKERGFEVSETESLRGNP